MLDHPRPAGKTRASPLRIRELNDISERGFPLEPSIVPVGNWLGKSFATFALPGLWITTADEVPDIVRLPIRLYVNGELRRDYNTADAEYGVDRLVPFASSVLLLAPKHVIA